MPGQTHSAKNSKKLGCNQDQYKYNLFMKGLERRGCFCLSELEMEGKQ